MSEASHSNVFVCQPQNRNVHGRVFGGFLMRQAGMVLMYRAWMYWVLPAIRMPCTRPSQAQQLVPWPHMPPVLMRLLAPMPRGCRRAFELAHATTYLFAGCRPLAGECCGRS